MKHIKICEFLKGFVYIIYLAPTYINILSIYAISNIHNVTWGSRPSVVDAKSQSKFQKIEKKLEINYKNFRSNFLIFWLILNLLVGNSVTFLNRKNTENTENKENTENTHKSIFSGLSYFLFAVMSFKLFFSSIYILKQR